MNKKLNIYIKIILAIILIYTAILPHEYTFYKFIRWLIMLSYIYFLVYSILNKYFELIVYYLGVAIIFNPIKQLWFHKETWHIIDYTVAITLISIATFQFFHIYKNHTKNERDN